MQTYDRKPSTVEGSMDRDEDMEGMINMSVTICRLLYVTHNRSVTTYRIIYVIYNVQVTICHLSFMMRH